MRPLIFLLAGVVLVAGSSAAAAEPQVTPGHTLTMPVGHDGNDAGPGAVTENSLGMKLVVIPAGEFQMGGSETTEDLSREMTAAGIEPHKHFSTDSERPQHAVRITKPFLMGVNEVTLGQFMCFYRDGYEGKLVSENQADGWPFTVESVGARPRKPPMRPWSWDNPKQTDEHPVVNVAWDDAVAFCRWLSHKEKKTYRLPTEAEWEYACRAGTTTRFWFGDDFKSLAENGNAGDQAAKNRVNNPGYEVKPRDGFAFTAPVGSYRKPNPFGLNDMHGNVAEWCSDGYDGRYYAQSPASDPTGPVGPFAVVTKVIRGGSWDRSPVSCRSASRDAPFSKNVSTSIGFRVVCELE